MQRGAAWCPRGAVGCCCKPQCVAVLLGLADYGRSYSKQVDQCHVPVHCSLLQCVAVCCRVMQGVAVRCSVPQCVAVCRSVLQGSSHAKS